jgi:hypothetical protein
MGDDVVYVVLQRGEGSWRIGGVPLAGGPPVFTEALTGRPPAMLAVGSRGIYFYAGPQRGVRRLTFDLARESEAGSGVICSPLAVSRSEAVVCANVGGLLELPASRGAPRPLALEPGGPVTAVVTSERMVFWIAERAENQLAVRALALPP